MTPLQELKARADRIGHALKLGTPQTEDCFTKMAEIEEVLADTKIDCLMHLRATSPYSGFEVLGNVIITIRDSTFKIINTIGDPVRDIEPIILSADLLDALGIHIALRRNLEVLKKQSVPIGQELDDLGSSGQRSLPRLMNSPLRPKRCSPN